MKKDPPTTDVRKLALNALNRIIEDGAYADYVTESILERSGLPPRDRRLFTALVNGCVKSMLTLDFSLKTYMKKDFEKLSPGFKNILRIGAYQLLFLDKIPSYAAINWATQLAKISFSEGFAGLANAVLRKIDQSPPAIDRDQPWDQYFALKYSLPNALMDIFARNCLIDFSDHAYFEEMMKFFQDPPETFLRVNRVKTDCRTLQEKISADKFSVKPYPFFPDDILIGTSGGSFRRSPSFNKGLYDLLTPGSFFAPVFLNPREGDVIIDLCAAPGGKTSLLSQLTGPQGLIIAVDKNKSRLDLLKKNCSRLGASNIATVNGDATELSRLIRNPVDKVLLDAPCSGLGSIGRKADLRYRIFPERIEKLPHLQRQMLNEAAKLVKPGGTIVYSVCTFTKSETIDVINNFLADNFRFKLANRENALNLRSIRLEEIGKLPDIKLTAEALHKSALFFDPLVFHADAFFFAKLVKIG